MKKALVVLVVLAVLAVAGALNYHVILTDNSVKIMRKVDMTLADTFVDARGVNRLKLILKPNLVKAGIKDVLNDNGIEVRK